MLPQIIGPGTFAPSPLAPSSTARTEQGAQPNVGETAAAAVQAETAERVDPPRVLPATATLPDAKRPQDTLLPPDPDAPAGPPPAFDASPLERARQEAFAPGFPEPKPPEPEAETAPPRDDTDPDDDLREKAEAEIAEVRRMTAPEPERSLDMLR
jgi:hypothetical protein